MNRGLLTIILISSLLSTCLCFWSTGHMIISRIAYEELRNKNMTLYKLIEDDVKSIQQFTIEVNHSFVEAAVWADDNKEVAFNQFTEWHFADTPYVMEDFEGEVPPQPANVTWGIDQMIRTLSYTKEPKFDNTLALSFSWRYLLHLIGDIHQPLHTSSMFSAQFPDGDMGGNLFKILHSNEEMKNLHALWDACVDQYGSMWAPLSNQEWEDIGKFADDIITQFPREKVQKRIDIKNPNRWAEESFDLAKRIVYGDLQSGDEITQEYLDRGRVIVNEQLAVGGYRLTDLLEKLAKKRYEAMSVKEKLDNL